MSHEDYIKSILQRIDWSFEGALSSYGLHRLHWYPATFIPQIPAYLIEIFSKEGQTIYDPFCGVGTTLLEAVRLGRYAMGSDVNALAVLVARAKLHFWEPDALRERVRSFEISLSERCEEYGLEPYLSLFSKLRAHPREIITTPDPVSHLRHWYHADTWREILVIRDLIVTQSGPFRELLDVLFSQMLKRSSSQRHHWGYVADNMIPKHLDYEDAIGIFQRSLADAVIAFDRFVSGPTLRNVGISELNSRSQVFEANILDGPVLQNSSVDLIVTSPPYPNVTDFARSQRLSVPWFNAALEELREKEIGARFKRHRSTAIADYFMEMEASIHTIAGSLRSGGYLCVVLGESEKQRQEVGVVSTLQRMVIDSGFTMPFEPIARSRSRERLKRRDGVSTDEYICIFRKQ